MLVPFLGFIHQFVDKLSTHVKVLYLRHDSQALKPNLDNSEHRTLASRMLLKLHSGFLKLYQ